MISKRKLLIIEITLIVTLLIVFIISMSDFNDGCEDIYSNMLRLHVIANSDSEKDQELKLLVRDEILKSGSSLFDGTTKKENAKSRLENYSSLLKKSAEEVLKNNGCDDKVKISFKKTYFNTREYDNIVVPAGFYDAVCVEIGDAKGKNWWCVMYPPLCLPAVSECDYTSVFNQSGNNVLNSTIKYDVRFKIVEYYQSSKKYIKKLAG